MTALRFVEVQKLRQGIHPHRDSTLHELCWHHPDLWGLLPERTDPVPVVPEWPQFLEGCLRYGARGAAQRDALRGRGMTGSRVTMTRARAGQTNCHATVIGRSALLGRYSNASVSRSAPLIP